jgi:glutathione synthase/RimK-type ligase-like ATP-grasp enzyme
MRKRKIVLYFSKKRETLDPFAGFGKKHSVYYELFKKGEEDGLEMYFSSGKDAYLGDFTFKNILKYEEGRFFAYEGNIKADAIYDRSASDVFPTKEISSKVLNGKAFKDLCWDKNKTYDFIGEFMPKSLKISNSAELISGLAKFEENELVVLKPAAGLGGRGIFIDYPKNLINKKIEKDTVLQKFVDTSGGIEGIALGMHDLRVVIIWGEIVLTHIREPKKGSYLANVSQGGSIKEVELNKIPKSILEKVYLIKNKIDKEFDNPIYAIDFGVISGEPFVFELNDQIGFPLPEMKNKDRFIAGLVKSLIRLAEK